MPFVLWMMSELNTRTIFNLLLTLLKLWQLQASSVYELMGEILVPCHCADSLVVVAGFALFLWDWCPLCPHREHPTPFLRTNLTSHGNQKIRRGGRILFETKCSSMINQVTLISKAAVFLMSTEQLCVSSCASLLPLFSSTVMWDGWLETIIY